MPGAHPRLPARPDLAPLGHVPAQHIRLLVVDARILFHTKSAHLGLAHKLAATARPAKSATAPRPTAAHGRWPFFIVYHVIAFDFFRQSGPPCKTDNSLERKLVFGRRFFGYAFFGLAPPVSQND